MLQAYVGKYKVDDEYWAMELKKGGLWLALNTTTAWRIYFTDATHFFVLEDAATYSVLLDSAGKVKAIGLDNEPFATKVE